MSMALLTPGTSSAGSKWSLDQEAVLAAGTGGSLFGVDVHDSSLLHCAKAVGVLPTKATIGQPG